MSGTINVLPATSPFTALSVNACRAMLKRTCFGHLVLVRQTHVDALPIRFAFVDTWLYFRADHGLARTLGHNKWVAILIAESPDKTHMSSVVARGACYATERTAGSAESDAAALRGVIRLRDRVPMGTARAQWVERATTVFRMHVDELRGRTGGAPSPADFGAARQPQNAV
jgi:nitroimidazol reductase NimA-like FMN-containing flavoprotein (pyridoxamine 5'-phosphate oxidase superfamily)